MQPNTNKLLICTLILVLAVQTAIIFFLIYKFNFIEHSLARNDAVIRNLCVVLKLHSNGIANVNNTATEMVTTTDYFMYQVLATGLLPFICLIFS